MNKENSLEEEDKHGTELMPVHYMYFDIGRDTSSSDVFFVKRHWHASCEILHIIKGSYEIELDFVSIYLNEGDYCFVNSGELHELRGRDRDTVHEVVIFNPNMLDFSYEDELELKVIKPLIRKEIAFPKVIKKDDVVYNDLALEYENITKAYRTGNREWQLTHRNTLDVRRNSEYEWYFNTKICLVKIMMLIYKYDMFDKAIYIENESEKIKIDRYKMLVSYMQKHYMEPVSLNDLQQVAGCNEKYLCQFFKKIAGVSPIQYLIQFRLNKSEYMLKHTTKSVLEISLDCGFDNVSYYIRQFKKYYGLTPLQYRKNL